MKPQARRVDYKVEGITCVNCVAELKKILNDLNIDNYDLDLETMTLTITIDPVKERQLCEKVREKGFSLLTSSESTTFRLTYLMISLPCILALNIIHLFHLEVSQYIQFVLSIPPLWFFGKSILFKAIKRPSFSLEFFVSISILAGLLLSVYSMVTSNHYLFFAETYSTTVFIIFLGSYFERKAFEKLNNAFPKYNRIFAESYKIIVSGIGKAKLLSVPPSDISLGSYLTLSSGDRSPVDLVVKEGACWSDESIITGQSYPIFKTRNDVVLAGSVVIEGQIVGEAVSDFFSSTLRKLINEFKNKPFEIVDNNNPLIKLLRVFVPIVLTIAFFTAIYNLYVGNIEEAFKRTLAVLVVACPCAVGLALPLVLSLAGMKALSFNTLVRSGEIFLLLPKLRSLFLDKTGTLTEDEFTIKCFQVYTQEALDRLISAQTFSNHPISKSILKVYNKPTRFFTISSKKVFPDSIIFIFQDQKSLEIRKIGPLEFEIILDGDIVGAFSLNQVLKDRIQNFLQFAKKRFNTVQILSGDKSDPRLQEMCKNLNIEIRFGMSPEDKMHVVNSARRPVLFAGDGLNDAMAISSADVGVSFSSSANIIKDKADIILLDPNLSNLQNLILLTDFSARLIRQNLFWAFIYNFVALPFAACGFISPSFGALGMFVSDLIVVLNSSRVQWFKPMA
ncbi:MAG: HAD-IC family P-type ATPase [Deltaproteobacteria bacterium]|nr:HAD-IC family P-type ATPase [Deltaproteobacteria bacterium]